MDQRTSFPGAEGDAADVVATTIAEFPEADSDSAIPIKKLDDAFDSCSNPVPKDAVSGGMRVVLRVRPCAAEVSTITVASETTITTLAPTNSKRAAYTNTEERHYSFSRVFAPGAPQTEVYAHTAAPLLERFLRGENCVLFAYGMTNSGKTYTIQGSNESPGVFPRLVKDILTQMKVAGRCSSSSAGDWELQVSMLEIYQEKLFDLLGDRKTKLTIRDGNGRVEVGKLTSHAVASAADAIRLLDTAAAQRSKSTTLLNSGSSRSHAVYTLTLHRASVGKDVIFQVVDLAGAERSNRTKATIQQQKEANNINVSLMQLWRCLQGMKRAAANSSSNNSSSSAAADIVPFRESKLTHLVMPLLSRAGLAGVAMIACVNPRVDDYDETLSILGNASLACKIKELADLGRTATQPATQAQQAQQQHLAEEQRQAQEVRMHELKMKAAAEVAAVGKKRRLEAAAASTAGAAAAAAALPAAKGAKRSSAVTLKAAALPVDAFGVAAATASAAAAADLLVAPPAKALKSASKNRVTLPQNNRGSQLISASKRTYSSMVGAPAAPLGSPARGNDETHVEEGDGDDDRISGSEVKRMRTEIARLREENHFLASEQLARETEIRVEVSEEMAVRSAHLLDQIQDLQEQLNRKESQVADVARSVRKVRRRQREQALEDRAGDVVEAEEELERVKAGHEAELAALQSEMAALEAQLREAQDEACDLRARLEVAERRITDAADAAGSVQQEQELQSEAEIEVPAVEEECEEEAEEMANEVEEAVGAVAEAAAEEEWHDDEEEHEEEASAEEEPEAEPEAEQGAAVEPEHEKGPEEAEAAEAETTEAEVDAEAEAVEEPEVVAVEELEAAEAETTEAETEVEPEVEPEAGAVEQPEPEAAEELEADAVEEPEAAEEPEVAETATKVETEVELEAAGEPEAEAVEEPQAAEAEAAEEPEAAESSAPDTPSVEPVPEPEAIATALATAPAVATASTAADVFLQRMQRDQRFKKAATTGPAAPAAAREETQAAEEPKRSPTRSPLGALQANSPARAPAVDKDKVGTKPDDEGTKKHATFAPSADAENAATNGLAPLKPRARVVSARNVLSARLTTQASNVLAAYHAAMAGEPGDSINPMAGGMISRLRSRLR